MHNMIGLRLPWFTAFIKQIIWSPVGSHLRLLVGSSSLSTSSFASSLLGLSFLSASDASSSSSDIFIALSSASLFSTWRPSQISSYYMTLLLPFLLHLAHPLIICDKFHEDIWQRQFSKLNHLKHKRNLSATMNHLELWRKYCWHFSFES